MPNLSFESMSATDARRITELRDIIKATKIDENLLICTFKALKKHGLTIPKALQHVKTNLKQNAHYDQIAYYKENTDCIIGKSGNLDFYDAFFWKTMGKARHSAMTYEISDHLPFWMELKVNEKEPDQLIKQEFEHF